jgi:aspartate-semialdehyde dehydrogenase
MYHVAVVGATGAVGQRMLTLLEERNFPIKTIRAVASRNSIHKQVSFGDDLKLPVEDLETFDFSTIDIALFSPGGEVSAIYAPKAAAQGCYVIDNTSYFRMDPQVPLVIPEINPQDLALAKSHRIISNPNCVLIQSLMALAPLHWVSPLKRVVMSTYQSVSGAGKSGIQELETQTKGIYMNQTPVKNNFPKQIAFNVIPLIGQVMEDGFTQEEVKLKEEARKILGPTLEVVATCVRVPVFVGHSVALFAEFHGPISLAQARGALNKMPGVQLLKQGDMCVTPIDASMEDEVFVDRLRVDPSIPHGLALWVVSDNLRKGAALNAVQIAEKLIDPKGGFFDA